MYIPENQELKDSLDSAPKKPGVYIFRSKADKIIYIGKAVNLYNRSRSYFANYKRLELRLQNMVSLADSIEYLEVENEVEALLLETNLIKKYRPKFNILMLDDKNYIWVKISRNQDFPRVSIVHSKLNDNSDYFGPFPAKRPIRRMLRDLRKIFPYRSCSRVIEVRKETVNGEEIEFVYSSNSKPCLYYHLGLCTAPCTTLLSKSDYWKGINNLKKFLRSEHKDLRQELENKMIVFSKDHKFEDAANVRDQLRDLDYLTSYTRITAPDFDDEELKRLKSTQSIEGVKMLIQKLDIDYPSNEVDLQKFRIECYDISNIQGTNATASMVVAVGGKKKNSDYRKFKIKSKDTPDDFAMLQEVLTRRLKYLLPDYGENKDTISNSIQKNEEKSEEDKNKPDESLSSNPNLIVIDGGKGQLSSVVKIMKEFYPSLWETIPVIGLAKREEEIFVPKYSEAEGSLDGFRRLKFGQRTPGLKLLQTVRDEAHRFGLGYHRLLRSKGMLYSELDLIPGIGEVTKKKLILAFGNVDGIRKASFEEIDAIIRNRNTARKIKKLLI